MSNKECRISNKRKGNSLNLVVKTKSRTSAAKDSTMKRRDFLKRAGLFIAGCAALIFAGQRPAASSQNQKSSSRNDSVQHTGWRIPH
jgi:hypothetical protein